MYNYSLLALPNTALILAALLSISYPGSYGLYNFWVYGTLGLTSVMAMMNMAQTIKAAKSDEEFNPLEHAISIYINSVAMFAYLVQIMGDLAASGSSSN